jgi:hypothetical protein
MQLFHTSIFAVLYILWRRKTYRVVGVRHGVEWTNSQWELVQNVEVCVVLQQNINNTVRARQNVEQSNSQGELVQNVEVCVVLQQNINNTVRARQNVKQSNSQWELVKHVEVCVILQHWKAADLDLCLALVVFSRESSYMCRYSL